MAPRAMPWARIPRHCTIRFALGSAFAGMVLIVSLLTGLVLNIAVSRYIRAELGKRLAQAARVAILQLDPDQHRRLREPADEATATYARLKRQLQQIRAQCSDVRYVYTTRLREDGRVAFVVDAEEDPALVSHLGDVYTDHPPELLEALTAPGGTRRAFVGSSFYTDKWGTWLSGYVPFFAADGRLEGALGLDMSAKMVLAYERRYQVGVLALCLLVTVVVVPVGVAVGRRLSKPLAQLEAEMARVQKFELDSQVSIRSRLIEIVSMVRQLENMKGGLRSFRKYVPADLVRQLIELGVEAELGGELEEVTIIFLDIAGFNAVSERLTPEELVEFLGEYLGEVTDVLLQHHATVDKYVGDTILAFWNAPVRLPDHVFQACRAALACRARIEQINRRWDEQGRGIAFRTRIGITTGEVIVGNIGSEQRLSYTIIGDSVNLASRVEGTNTFYGTDILVTGASYLRVRDRIVGRIVDRVTVKGKKVPIDLYEILGTREETAPVLVEFAERYGHGFELYASRQFGEAVGVLEGLLGRNGDDRATRQLLERCHHFLAHPPAAEWDGSYTFTHK